MGSHSVQKYPANFAKTKCTLEEIDIRGRWKRHGTKVVDRYIDVKQEYIDGKVAATLCIGGPVKYELVEGSGLTKEWLEEKVVPGISDFFHLEDNNIAFVLALPLLWAIMDSEQQKRVPDWLITKVMVEYNKVVQLPSGENPVSKCRLIVFLTTDGNLSLTGVGADGKIKDETTTSQEQYRMDQLNAILVNQQTMQQQIESIKEEMTNMVTIKVNTEVEKITKNLEVINNNVKRLLIQPARRIFKENNNDINEEEGNKKSGGY